jgi:hypothetical protein
MEWNLLDAFDATLVFGTHDQPVWAISELARVQLEFGGDFLIEDGCRLVVEIDADVRFGHGGFPQRSGRRMSYLG